MSRENGMSKDSKKKFGFSTRAIHIGQEPESVTGAVSLPLHQTSTFRQKEFAEYDFDYSRADNPNRRSLEQNIASLENGKYGIAFGSGTAASSAIFSLFEQGSHIILSENVYGGTFRLVDKIFSRYNFTASWVDSSNVDKIEQAIQPNTKLIFIETPSNPLMRLSDIQLISKIANKYKILFVVDNTFMSPYYQRPLTLGADIVVHSTTKYINGHSDLVGGIVVTNINEIDEQLRFIQMSAGAVPGPFDCWLTQRSLKTLAVRMKAHNQNALKIAKEIEKSAKILNIFYPGLKSHPQYELALKQQFDPFGNPGFGGMISIELPSLEDAKKFVKGLKLFTLAESLGGVESLVCHPSTMTHASIPESQRKEIGISDGLIRLSVGIEDIEDLLNDIQFALDR
ncbi:MAG: PLP-dependent transferase [Candidatus Marinimicrobia bacterium]|nr:PLP-dependent transferase [Candidatus Neomarinimicrobiota bacterium]MBL7022798.1 PLP-dependent transferase [Candidatus Neomarinimicrobiota bacterium]MBL7109365.1 PLP-dependent transferase [Candidatus Neomarinimicrobiota bacterium]